MLEEIKYPKYEVGRPDGEPCPYCKIPTRFDQIPCPEGRPGCLVMHYGFICEKCGRIFMRRENRLNE